jgi:uncharacterized SAM-dependent methyltransferase
MPPIRTPWRRQSVPVALIDLGAGNCAKAASLFGALQPRQYVPVDISTDFLHQSVQGLQRRFPDIPMQPLAMDFSSTLTLPPEVDAQRQLFFYPGSSLGNFDPQQALAFLRRLRVGAAARRWRHPDRAGPGQGHAGAGSRL